MGVGVCVGRAAADAHARPRQLQRSRAAADRQSGELQRLEELLRAEREARARGESEMRRRHEEAEKRAKEQMA